MVLIPAKVTQSGPRCSVWQRRVWEQRLWQKGWVNTKVLQDWSFIAISCFQTLFYIILLNFYFN